MAVAESEEFAFWLQIGELNKANADCAFAVQREWDASARFSMMEENEELRPRQLVDEVDILTKVLAACCRRNEPDLSTSKPFASPAVGNADWRQPSVFRDTSANNFSKETIAIEHKKNTKESFDFLPLRKALPLSVTKGCEEPKDSDNHMANEHADQFPLSGRSHATLPNFETSSSTSPLDLRIDELLMELVSFRNHRITEHGQCHKEELELDKDLSDMHSEMLAREQQLCQDELLARRIETENLNQSFTESDSVPKSVFPKEDQVYDLFFAEARDERGYVGVACVMKDTEGEVVFQNRECLGAEMSHHFAEYTALINGLAYARSTGVRRINAYGNRAFIYWEFQGMADMWTSELLNLMDALYKQIMELSNFNVNCISRTENEDAINLAKRALTPYWQGIHYNKWHIMRLKGKARMEDDTRKECLICLEKVFPSDMVCQKGCEHRFCFNCLSQHVETEILASKVPIRCPQFFTCAIHMGLYDCQRLVTPALFDTYTRRLAEATISDSEKVYCPFPSCSVMMCRNDDRKSIRTTRISSWSPLRRTPSTCTQCVECHRLFCVECGVPWHANLSCQQYQRLPPNERDEDDIKLLELAKEQNWRRCKKCRSLIVLAHGCFHMTCRCGYEFCYTCETEYENKKKMCRCPLFPVAASPLRRR